MFSSDCVWGKKHLEITYVCTFIRPRERMDKASRAAHGAEGGAVGAGAPHAERPAEAAPPPLPRPRPGSGRAAQVFSAARHREAAPDAVFPLA